MNPVVANAIEQLKNAERLDFWEAAKLLVAEEDRSVVPELITLLTSGADTARRVAAAWTLGFMHAADALGPLIVIVEDKSQPPQLRDHAAEALVYLRHSAAIVHPSPHQSHVASARSNEPQVLAAPSMRF